MEQILEVLAIANILDLVPFKDGSQWSVLWGKDLQSGIAAFGETPIEALIKFYNQLTTK